MTEGPNDPARHETILKAAFEIFAQQGYKGTSMEDIARATGLSRPTLYLSFRNKEDICRSLVAVYYQTAQAQVAVALRSERDPALALRAAFLAQAGEIKEVIFNSPYAAELMDAGSAVASDIAADGEAGLQAVYADWLEERLAQGSVVFSEEPKVLADMFMHALHGIKTPPYGSFVVRLDALARMLGAALQS